MRKRLLRLLERKHTIDDGLDLIHRDRPVHLVEHLAIADEDAVKIASLVHQQTWTGVAVAASHEANQAYYAAAGQRLPRPRERPAGADLDDAVYSAAGRMQHFLLDVRRWAVIDGGRGSHLQQELELLIA